jgi:penicillin-binding protein 1A
MTFHQHGGASTIEMQFVRTVTGRYEHTLRRKLQEVVLSFLVDYHVDKIAVLRSYLRLAYFGTHVRGAEAAASRVYGRALEQLSTEEAAVIAAMLVYPIPRVPSEAWLRKVQRRAAYGLKLHARLHKSLQKPPI